MTSMIITLKKRRVQGRSNQEFFLKFKYRPFTEINEFDKQISNCYDSYTSKLSLFIDGLYCCAKKGYQSFLKGNQSLSQHCQE